MLTRDWITVSVARGFLKVWLPSTWTKLVLTDDEIVVGEYRQPLRSPAKFRLGWEKIALFGSIVTLMELQSSGEVFVCSPLWAWSARRYFRRAGFTETFVIDAPPSFLLERVLGSSSG